jgi:hypothetical protein
MRICGLQYTIEHIEGANNVWADIISRWAAPPPMVHACAVRTRSQVEDLPEPSVTRLEEDAQFSFPTREDIAAAQREYADTLRSENATTMNDEGLVCVDGRPWVPSKAKELLARLMIVSHCGGHGHRGQDAMVQLLDERFFIEKMVLKVQEFLRQCLLCKHVRSPSIQQRVWGPTYKATRRNEVLHWDYLFLGDGYGNDRYVLVMKDSVSHYCELFPCAVPTSMTSVPRYRQLTVKRQERIVVHGFLVELKYRVRRAVLDVRGHHCWARPRFARV